jgi:hypothetical protein
MVSFYLWVNQKIEKTDLNCLLGEFFYQWVNQKIKKTDLKGQFVNVYCEETVIVIISVTEVAKLFPLMYFKGVFQDTVKPVYNGHPWDSKKVAFVQR